MFQRNKTVFTIIGFLLFILGASELILNLVGIRFAFMTWLDAAGRLLGFVLRLLMMIAGIVLAVLANTHWWEDTEDKDEYIRRNERR